MVCFLLVDQLSAYNVIIGRVALKKFGTVTSTPHLKMKFPMDHKVGKVKGDQQMAQQRYNVLLKESLKASIHVSCNKEDK
jgi:hypothetical protein